MHVSMYEKIILKSRQDEAGNTFFPPSSSGVSQHRRWQVCPVGSCDNKKAIQQILKVNTLSNMLLTQIKFPRKVSPHQ